MMERHLQDLRFLLFIALMILTLPVYAQDNAGLNADASRPQPEAAVDLKEEPPTSDNPEANGLLTADFNNAPTYIKAETLRLKSNERVFEYSGNVEVIHGDLTMTSNTLEGNYDDKNEIQQLVARGDVIIIKGEGIRANGERAIYEKSSETITLTDNPELQQKESVLTADKIRIFLNEDRSLAEGHVRVKMVEEKGSKKGKPTNTRSLLK